VTINGGYGAVEQALFGEVRATTTRKLTHDWRNADSIVQWWTTWMCLIGLCWVCISGIASAQVPRIQGQGAAASAMGNAFAAQADDPSALHYNPAGMTQLQGSQLMAGALFSGGRH
jgi:thiamine monophosphate synthase